jgi:acyl carrier protein
VSTIDYKHVKEKLKELIVAVADFPLTTEEISDEENGIRKLGLNSLSLIKMVAKVEKEFSIETDYEETSPDLLASVNKLADYIVKKQIVNKNFGG